MNQPYDTPARDFDEDPNGAIRAKVQHTQQALRGAIDGANARNGRLENLSDKADNLSLEAGQFRQKANSARKRECIKEYKWRVIVGLGIIALIALIVIPIAVTQSKKD